MGRSLAFGQSKARREAISATASLWVTTTSAAGFWEAIFSGAVATRHCPRLGRVVEGGMFVSRIWIYPIKSPGGVEVSPARISAEKTIRLGDAVEFE
jgi:hypothetical protein